MAMSALSVSGVSAPEFSTAPPPPMTFLVPGHTASAVTMTSSIPAAVVTVTISTPLSPVGPVGPVGPVAPVMPVGPV